MTNRELFDRIREDFDKGGEKLGRRSTARLLHLIERLVTDVENLERVRKESLAGYPGYD